MAGADWVCYSCRGRLPTRHYPVEISYYLNEEYKGCQRCNIPNPRWLLTWMASILQCDIPVIEAIYYNAIDISIYTRELSGRRFAYLEEDSNNQLNLGLMMQLTGGDTFISKCLHKW